MIPYGTRLFPLVILLAHLLSGSVTHAWELEEVREQVRRVVDGDTLELAGGQRVRLLGIDAPEKGMALWEEASARLGALVASRTVTLRVCQERDHYGRLLAKVEEGNVSVNGTLLREGLALPLLIPPCGRAVVDEVLRDAAAGAVAGKGLYSLAPYRMVSSDRATDFIGERCLVRGRVLQVHQGRKAWHLNFGEDWKTDFTAGLFREGLDRFRHLGLDPRDLEGREVLVIGKVKRYNGPQIILRGPDQILPVSETPDP